MKNTTRLLSGLLASVAMFTTGTMAAQNDPSIVDQTLVPAATPQLAASGAILHDGSFVGGTYNAYYGVVQVQATVQGGHIVNVKALKYPNHSGTSRSINRQALPYLLQEVVAKQSTRIATITGASLTSDAYIYSLRDALQQAAN